MSDRPIYAHVVSSIFDLPRLGREAPPIVAMAIMVEPESMCLFSCTTRSANIGLALASAFEAGAVKLNNSLIQYSSRDKLMYITTTCLRDFNDAKLRAVAATYDVAITCDTESPDRSQIARLVHSYVDSSKAIREFSSL